MSDYARMSQLLCALLLLSGGLRLLRRTLCAARGSAALPAAALMTGYGLLSASLCAIVTRFTGIELLLPALLLLVTLLTGAAALAGLSRLRGWRSLAPVLLLMLWGASALCVTVLLRPAEDTRILLRFDAFSDVARLGSLRPLGDVLLNLLLFLPLGALLPLADPEPRLSWLNVLSTALLLTAAIEGLQLMFRLGQADVEDLAANVLGAACAMALSPLLHRPSPQ